MTRSHRRSPDPAPSDWEAPPPAAPRPPAPRPPASPPSDWERAPEEWFRPGRRGQAPAPARRLTGAPRRDLPPATPAPSRPAGRKRRRHPWGTIIVLSLSLTLAVYGLLRFGYQKDGHLLPAPTGHASGTRAGAAPPVLVKRHDLFGMATKGAVEARVKAFTSGLGRQPDVVEYYNQFGTNFPRSVAYYLAQRHILSLIQINPRKASLAAIVAGKYDTYLRNYADQVRAFGARVAISFGHEMNGWWYPWSIQKKHTPAQVKTIPAAFVGAWQHIHDVFKAQRASNVIWVWTLSRIGTFRGWAPIKAWWPGHQYVNWVGMDGYFRRSDETFRYLFRRQLATVRKFTADPVLITETAVDGTNPNAASQIQQLVAGVSDPANNLMGFIWFDVNALSAWNIDHARAEIADIHQAMARYHYYAH